MAESLWQASRPCDVRSTCVLPLATLLENIAGLYAPLLAGARIELRPLAEIGFSGAAGFELPFAGHAAGSQPHSLILLPQLLLALVSAAEQGVPLPASLRFVAVGGGRVAPQLLNAQSARPAGVRGLRLSECASVVCLNTPRHGASARSAGAAHVELRLADDGEVLVRGPHARLSRRTAADRRVAGHRRPGHFEDGF